MAGTLSVVRIVGVPLQPSHLAVTNPVTQNRGILIDCPDAYLYY
jgi:hypothetical protein